MKVLRSLFTFYSKMAKITQLKQSWEPVLITQEEIHGYIRSIPPSPAVLKTTLAYIQEGELAKAANEASQDPALKLFLQEIVNKPIYGFKNDIKDLKQIFGVLGLAQAEQVIYNYMISLLTPSKWELFSLNNKEFSEIQDSLTLTWKKILEHKGIDDKSLFSSISLLPASIIVCEALFKAKKDELDLLRSVKEIDYNTILKRLSGMDLFDLCAHIAKIWEMPEPIAQIVLASSGRTQQQDPQIIDLSKWMHLLFFYQLSQPLCVKAGLNDFIEFNIEYVQEIYEEFQDVVMQG
jgi:HD-like signal output (HDOD) protein